MNAKRLKQLVDELGALRAQQATLKEREADLRDELIASGYTEAEGVLFRAVVVESDRKLVDWKAIAAKLQPSRQLVAAHTRHSMTTSVRVSARKGVQS